MRLLGNDLDLIEFELDRGLTAEHRYDYADRILFGLDICTVKDPCCLPGWLDEHYLAGNISEDVYYKICRGNAIRELKLGLEA